MANPPPNWLDSADKQRVSDAVAAAEAGSSGEIVTILAERSDSYHDVALVWSAITAITALIVVSLRPEFYLSLLGSITGLWNTEWTLAHAFAIAAFVAAIKFVGMWVLMLWSPLRLALTPRWIKTARVHERAVSAFRIGAERRTQGRTGILIYLSMREHRAEIVADEAITSQINPEVWGDAMAAMLNHLSDGRVADGMCEAVERVGKILAAHIPRAADDINELPDRLIEL
jgi:putative membrane protein